SDEGATWRTVEDVREYMLKAGVVQAVQDEDCLEIKPAHPSSQREARLDRGSLTTFIAACEAKHTPTLDDVGNLAEANSTEALQHLLGALYCAAYLPGFSWPASCTQFDWDLVRFWNSFDTTVREALREGKRVRLLGGASSNDDVLYRLFLGDHIGALHFVPTAERPVVIQPSIRWEVTEFLPNGVPDGCYVQATVQEEPGLLLCGADLPVSHYVETAQQLASLRFARESGNAGILDSLPRRGLVGTYRRIAISICLNDSWRKIGILWEATCPHDSKLESDDQLPATFEAGVLKEMDALRRNYSSIRSRPTIRDGCLIRSKRLPVTKIVNSGLD
ncbi:MAG TPA: hypothetical protein VG944_10745, partial [Fimbriimonas sp.]|nr:hypothetical protein [Fimbriimonas sp.]